MVVAAYSLAVVLILYLGLFVRALYWHQALGRPVAVPIWPLLTSLASLVVVLLIYAPATALTDWLFRRRKEGLTAGNLALSFALAAAGAGVPVWLAASTLPLPFGTFLGVASALVAPGFTIYWITLHVMEGTLDFAGQMVATTLEILGWTRQ
jgi:hypothetical protein